MKKLSSFLPVVAGLALLGGAQPLLAQNATPASTRAETLPAATPAESGTLPAPTPTPGGPVLPTEEQKRTQGAAISQVRRLIRDVQANTNNMKAVGNFGAQLYIIADETFFQDWKKPETPNLTPISLVVRNQPVYTVVIFYGPARDNKGLSNVSYDLTVKRPDGTVYTERKTMVGWQNLAPDERKIILAPNYLNITINPTDPAGIYTVEAVIHDNVSRTDLPLKQTFAVQ